MRRLVPLAAFALAVLAIVLWAVVSARSARREIEQQAIDGLAASVSTKVAAVSEWRDAQVRIARLAASYPTVGTLASGRDDGALRHHAVEVLRNVAEHFDFSAIGVATSDGTPVVVWTPGHAADATANPALVGRALADPFGVATRLSVAEGDLQFLDVAVAVEPGNPERGAVFLRADARAMATSTIVTWNEPSQPTTTVLVVARAGEALVFGRPASGRPNGRSERIPFSADDRVAVQAARGSMGVVRGVDADGHPVIAYSKEVPGTDWIVQTRVAEDEVERRFTKAERIVAALVGALILAGAFLIAIWWRRDVLRERMEERLRESEAHFRTLADSGQALIWTAGADGRREYVNRSWLSFTGRSEQQELGTGWTEGVHPDDLDRWLATYRDAFAGRERFSLDYRLRTGSGEYRWVQADGAPRFDSRGRFIGYIGHCLDISERKRHEAERERLMTAIEQASEVIVLTDPQGVIQYANPAFSRVTGYAVAEAVGQNPRILRSGRHDEAFYRNLWATITRGETWTGMMVNRRKDGSTYTEDATITPVRDSTGQITNFVAVKRDITDTLRMEAQLREVQRMESIGRLAGGVAHDFNNILAVILSGASHLLESTPKDDPHREELVEIRMAGERGATLTRQLLAFSRKQVLDIRTIDLNQVVSDIEKMLRRLIGEDVSLVIRLSPPGGKVRADRGQVEQVIMNLVVNAKDAMPSGGTLTIEVADVDLDDEYARAHPGVKPGHHVRLAISDTGCGIDAATMEHIFEPFFTTKARGKGTGLGLSTVYGIVKQSGGHLTVDSEPNRGATFNVLLPGASGEAPPAPEDDAGPTTTGGGETILVVEDEDGVRRATARMLSRAGYRVLTAASANEALELCEEHAHDIRLLVADVVMPGARGTELASRLRTLRPGIRVVLMSGYPDVDDIAGDISGTGTAFIGKPFTSQALLRVVRRVLDDA